MESNHIMLKAIVTKAWVPLKTARVRANKAHEWRMIATATSLSPTYHRRTKRYTPSILDPPKLPCRSRANSAVDRESAPAQLRFTGRTAPGVSPRRRSACLQNRPRCRVRHILGSDFGFSREEVCTMQQKAATGSSTRPMILRGSRNFRN